jgi:hypothetical protein
MITIDWNPSPSELRRWAVRTALALGVMVLTGSRTGLAGVFVLAAWGALDRRLPPPVRWARRRDT